MQESEIPDILSLSYLIPRATISCGSICPSGIVRRAKQEGPARTKGVARRDWDLERKVLGDAHISIE